MQHPLGIEKVRLKHGTLTNIVLLGRARDDVVGEDVVSASHGKADAVQVVLERVARHICLEGLEHGQPSITISVDVVVCGNKEAVGRINITKMKKLINSHCIYVTRDHFRFRECGPAQHHCWYSKR